MADCIIVNHYVCCVWLAVCVIYRTQVPADTRDLAVNEYIYSSKDRHRNHNRIRHREVEQICSKKYKLYTDVQTSS